MEIEFDLVFCGVGLCVIVGCVVVFEVFDFMVYMDVEWVYCVVFEVLLIMLIQLVYNIFVDLMMVGFICWIELVGFVVFYEWCIDDNYYYIVCIFCGVIGDVDCVVGEVLCFILFLMGGFIVEIVEVIFWGFCFSCQNVVQQFG